MSTGQTIEFLPQTCGRQHELRKSTALGSGVHQLSGTPHIAQDQGEHYAPTEIWESMEWWWLKWGKEKHGVIITRITKRKPINSYNTHLKFQFWISSVLVVRVVNHSDKVIKVALIQVLAITFVHFHKNTANMCLGNFLIKLIPSPHFAVAWYVHRNNGIGVS